MRTSAEMQRSRMAEGNAGGVRARCKRKTKIWPRIFYQRGGKISVCRRVSVLFEMVYWCSGDAVVNDKVGYSVVCG